MKHRPHHLALKVLDLDRCARFYTEVLDLEILARQRAEDGSVRSVWFDLGGMILMLERYEEEEGEGKGADENRPRSDPAPAGWHLLALAIARQDRGWWRDRLCRAGVRITGESAYSLYFRDPENNRLALSHYPEAENGTS